jgi:anthraniloyl-CoA monooxygenase
MRVACIGGGPAGLYFGLLMKRADPRHDVVVYERNRADDTFGWGVVFSDQTLGALRQADPETAERIHDAFNHWDDIEIRFKGERIRSSGHGFCGIGRRRLLDILRDRATGLGVDVRYSTEIADDAIDADVIVASDGLNSRTRDRHRATYQPDVDLRRCRFVWLGTTRLFDAFTFDFQPTPHGWFQAHAYRFDRTTSTFIVETLDETWRRAGLDTASKDEGIVYCERLFAEVLEGAPLMSNASHLRGSAQWVRFPRVVCRRWVHEAGGIDRRRPVALMGDAAHTAHFSVGSGTKLALEDAIGLADAIRRHDGDLPAALAEYEAIRSVEVLKIQNAARNSTEWFESVDRHARLEPTQFAYSLLTRSQRISHENLRLRDRGYVARIEDWVAARASGVRPLSRQGQTSTRPPLPMLTPFRLRGLTLQNRIVVSPMAQYSAVDGVPGDFYLVHLGARALGGAGLVFTEMTAPSPEGRITLGCAGLWTGEQQRAWTRIVDFVHAYSNARIALQLGHSGAKGGICRPWEGDDVPLVDGGWPLLAPSRMQYVEGVSAWARAMTRDDMDRMTADFVAAARRGAAAGFDGLELHCAHGYLLSAFLSPLTNQRDDEYGGSLERRLRYPLEVFSAMRAVWPAEKPMSVRISAHDWVPGGTTPEDAIAIAHAFKRAGCDLMDVSSGQVSRAQRPIYGRMYQTPFAEAIRNEVGIATMAVGAITDADQVNGIIAAGRADLCALARPHLVHPAWTLTEAARLGVSDGPGLTWPVQYLSGRDQLVRLLERERAAGAGAAAERENRALGV